MILSAESSTSIAIWLDLHGRGFLHVQRHLCTLMIRQVIETDPPEQDDDKRIPEHRGELRRDGKGNLCADHGGDFVADGAGGRDACCGMFFVRETLPFQYQRASPSSSAIVLTTPSDSVSAT